MKNALGKKVMKLTSAVLAASVFAALATNYKESKPVYAATLKNADNTTLGTSQIGNPKAPADKDDPWTGNYVYFGEYDSNPIKFRVLASNTDVYGEDALFLDSDRILFSADFNSIKGYPSLVSSYDNSWDNSDLREYLNGEFLTNSFTGREKNTILGCYGSGGVDAFTPGSYEEVHYKEPSKLVDDRVFLLDGGEILNPDYGYYHATGCLYWASTPWQYETVKNHTKEGEGFWWLRTETTDPADEFAGGISNEGEHPGVFSSAKIGEGGADLGVAPALNVKQSSILFSTEIVAPDSDGYNGEYKLTVIDESIDFKKLDGFEGAFWSSETGAFLEVPYKSTSGVTTYALLILDKEYAAGNTNGAKILYYGNLTEANNLLWSETGLDKAGWGTEYFVYTIAEIRNADSTTDYSSVPIKLDKPADVVYEPGPADYAINVTTDGNGTASASTTYALTGDEITLTATPNDGYQFKEWQVIAGNVTITDNKFILGVYDVQIKAIFEESAFTPYSLVKIGDKEVTAEETAAEEMPKIVTDTTSDSTFTIKPATGVVDNSFENFDYVAVDGVKLTKDVDYTVTKGSTIITLKASYLKTLSAGEHVILVNFKDGSTAVKLTVNAAPAPANMPATGESQTAMLTGSVLVIAALGIMFVVEAKKRKEEA